MTKVRVSEIKPARARAPNNRTLTKRAYPPEQATVPYSSTYYMAVHASY